MTEPESTLPSGSPRWLSWGLASLIFAASLAFFASGRDAERLFMDEAAFLSQAYFGDLLLSGRTDSALWLEYAGYDLPPLPKYLINGALRLSGEPRPERRWALAWYANSKTDSFVTPRALRAARGPSLLLGAAGCAVLFAIGALAADRRVGLLAALFLAANPLYRLHARRAMADVPTEAFSLAAVAVALWMARGMLSGWSWRSIVAGAAGIGVLGGVAVLAKLSGGLGLMVAWALLLGSVVGWSVPTLSKSEPEMVGTGRPTRWRVLADAVLAIAVSGLVSLVVFIALNPFVTARPKSYGPVPLMAPVPREQSIPQRIGEVVHHRAGVSLHAMEQFPDDALPTLPAKAAALAVQGFGRFGPLGPAHSDSRIRFDWRQDFGALIWLPLVLVGFGLSLGRGRRRGRGAERSLMWALAVQFAVAVLTVGLFLPLAWDRYFLPIQGASCLLGAYAIVAMFDAIRGHGR